MFDVTLDLRVYQLNATLTFLDLGPSNAAIKVYSGTKPATGTALLPDNVLLFTQDLLKPSGYIDGSGFLNLFLSSNPVIANSGTATWCRFVNGNGLPAADGLVTTFSGIGQLRLRTTVLVAGRTVVCRVARLK